MSKIIRKTASIFASAAEVNQLEQFGAKEVTGNYNGQSPPADPAVIQSLSAWEGGWSSAQYEVFAPYLQDRNAVDYVNSYQIAYLLQMGVPEWDAGTTYYTNSIVQYGGQIFKSLQDSNLNNTPPLNTSNGLWQIGSLQYLKYPTRTILTSGSGTYNPPFGCVRIYVRMVGGGGGGGGINSGTNTEGNPGTGTTFSSSNISLTCFPGEGGNSINFNSTGGTASGGDLNIYGCNGNVTGGGNSRFGSGGLTSTNVQYANAVIYGSGGGNNTSSPFNSGAAGGYLEKLISNIDASYSYEVGIGGAGGAGSSSGGAGGRGAPGIIIIDEFYY